MSLDQDLVDREGGVFLMQYEGAAQFDVREFFRTGPEPEELDPGLPVGESVVSEAAEGAADGVETLES